MKKLCISTLVAVVVLVSCGEPDPTVLRITFITNPSGGYVMSYIDCVVAGTIHDNDDIDPIRAKISWMWSETSSGSGQDILSDYYTFDLPDEEADFVTVYYEAQYGYYLLGYWWVLVEWTNEDGTQKQAESSKAYCYD